MRPVWSNLGAPYPLIPGPGCRWPALFRVCVALRVRFRIGAAGRSEAAGAIGRGLQFGVKLLLHMRRAIERGEG